MPGRGRLPRHSTFVPCLAQARPALVQPTASNPTSPAQTGSSPCTQKVYQGHVRSSRHEAGRTADCHHKANNSRKAGCKQWLSRLTENPKRILADLELRGVATKWFAGVEMILTGSEHLKAPLLAANFPIREGNTACTKATKASQARPATRNPASALFLGHIVTSALGTV